MYYTLANWLNDLVYSCKNKQKKKCVALGSKQGNGFRKGSLRDLIRKENVEEEKLQGRVRRPTFDLNLQEDVVYKLRLKLIPQAMSITCKY